MSSVHHWYESNLVGEDETADISNINFGSVDEPNIVPSAHLISRGQNSFSKYIRCKFTGTWTEILNMKLWKSAGEYVAGETIKAAANVAYDTPSQVGTGDGNIPIVEGSALHIHSAEGLDTIVYGDTGVTGYTTYIRLQEQTTGSTPAGAVASKTILFQYDES